MLDRKDILYYYIFLNKYSTIFNDFAGLVEYLSIEEKGFTSLYSAVILSKCFKAKLWENSKYVSRQLEKIGKFI